MGSIIAVAWNKCSGVKIRTKPFHCSPIWACVLMLVCYYCRPALGKHTVTVLRGSKFLKAVSGSSKSLTYPRIHADSIVWCLFQMQQVRLSRLCMDLLWKDNSYLWVLGNAFRSSGCRWTFQLGMYEQLAKEGVISGQTLLFKCFHAHNITSKKK